MSKERLNEIALEVAKEQYSHDVSKWPDEYTQRVKDFALALIRRVEAECEYDPTHIGEIDIPPMNEIAQKAMWKQYVTLLEETTHNN